MMTMKAAMAINIVAGIWLFVSPWVYQSYSTMSAWNNWVVGALMVIIAATRLSSPASWGISLLNLVLGAWTFASPWIYGYSGATDRLINSLCVGAVVFILAAFATSHRMGRPTGAPPAVLS